MQQQNPLRLESEPSSDVRWPGRCGRPGWPDRPWNLTRNTAASYFFDRVRADNISSSGTASCNFIMRNPSVKLEEAGSRFCVRTVHVLPATPAAACFFGQNHDCASNRDTLVLGCTPMAPQIAYRSIQCRPFHPLYRRANKTMRPEMLLFEAARPRPNR